VRLSYFFWDVFGSPPDVTMRQDEVLLYDIMRFHRQVGYERWAQRHEIEDYDPAGSRFADDALDYRKMFGLGTEDRG